MMLHPFRAQSDLFGISLGSDVVNIQMTFQILLRLHTDLIHISCRCHTNVMQISLRSHFRSYSDLTCISFRAPCRSHSHVRSDLTRISFSFHSDLIHNSPRSHSDLVHVLAVRFRTVRGYESVARHHSEE